QLEVDVGGEILVDNSKKSERASSDEYLIVPMYGGQTETGDVDTLTVKKPIIGTKTSTRVNVAEIEVQPGDTLYSLSRKYSVPVNDLAVMNKLNPPFALRVGQKIRVPNLEQAMVAKDVVVENKVKQESVQKEQTQSKTEVKTAKAEKKISSDPSKKLPKINARSSSKFSWPVRGKILSAYGAKNNGLFNDGVNIASAKGTSVVVAENGVVAYAGNEIKGMGNLIIVQHESGWMTVYAHLDSMNVKRGTKVNVGQKIGTVGETGKVDSPQLHFEIRKGTKAYDPISYMKK
ncbi:MAG: peptidoglycan DD-metalloendopeptidase family protein, partial [Alphaproteobacteria bacterium]